MSLLISSTDSITSLVVKFLKTNISAIAPALSKALLVSYSQFVPGNAGMKTLGFVILIKDLRLFSILL